ncbi:MAG TPA: Arm DNA-binding domain-containing protein [Rhizomicrobium sp.]|jgi:hypothetical protein|nr:Arm DNA-binding domain-containing protein [Rhizomicrobium sp.]
MARQIARLNALAVSKLKKPGMYADGAGLYLQVSAAGTKSWIFRFTMNDRKREMGLGPLLDVSLAEAREKAHQCRNQKRDGTDPIEARKSARQQAQLEAVRAFLSRTPLRRMARPGGTTSTATSGATPSLLTLIRCSAPSLSAMWMLAW